MNKKQLKEILNKLKNELKISETIKIELKPMKTKAASISLNKNTIRINKNIIPNLDAECITYLLLHELIHFKLRSTYHNEEFHKQINNKINEEKTKQIERKILTTLLHFNHIL